MIVWGEKEGNPSTEGSAPLATSDALRRRRLTQPLPRLRGRRCWNDHRGSVHNHRSTIRRSPALQAAAGQEQGSGREHSASVPHPVVPAPAAGVVPGPASTGGARAAVPPPGPARAAGVPAARHRPRRGRNRGRHAARAASPRADARRGAPAAGRFLRRCRAELAVAPGGKGGTGPAWTGTRRHGRGRGPRGPGHAAVPWPRGCRRARCSVRPGLDPADAVGCATMWSEGGGEWMWRKDGEGCMRERGVCTQGRGVPHGGRREDGMRVEGCLCDNAHACSSCNRAGSRL